MICEKIEENCYGNKVWEIFVVIWSGSCWKVFFLYNGANPCDIKVGQASQWLKNLIRTKVHFFSGNLMKVL